MTNVCCAGFPKPYILSPLIGGRGSAATGQKESGSLDPPSQTAKIRLRQRPSSGQGHQSPRGIPRCTIARSPSLFFSGFFLHPVSRMQPSSCSLGPMGTPYQSSTLGGALPPRSHPCPGAFLTFLLREGPEFEDKALAEYMDTWVPPEQATSHQQTPRVLSFYEPQFLQQQQQ